MSELGKVMLLAGLGLALAGALMIVAARVFPSLGNLPGDIRLDGENGKVFIPITSMILISVIGTIVLNLLIRFFRR